MEGAPFRALSPKSTPFHRPAAGAPPHAGEATKIVDPERALAITYAPASARAALAALFALDERLGAIVAATTEPTVGLIRLVWWREALEALDARPAPAEPLLRALAGQVRPHVAGATLAAIEDGWAALIDGGDAATLVERHARERGGGLFAAAAAILGAGDARLAPAGAAWALADLAHRHSAADVRAAARARARIILRALPSGGWARHARPLAALVALARRDVAREGPRRQGAPGRVLRMLAMRLFGR